MIIESIIFALGLGSVVSTETTGKGLTDHAISAAKDKDCKMSRGLQGEDVCLPKSSVTVESANNEKPKVDIPPVVPPPKKVVVVSTSIDDTERVFAQRKAQK
jgi:hypothetical protein